MQHDIANGIGFSMEITEFDRMCFERAISLACEAEEQNNLPIGAVIAYQGKIIAEGKNAIWHPEFDATRHAEMEALRSVPKDLWQYSREMTLYTTLEPCIMCMGSILMHYLGRIMFGTADPYGGGSMLAGHLPPYFEDQLTKVEWVGPAYPMECDKLYQRSMALVEKRREIDP
jgi:tRNA(adenine34) deaminase